MKNRITRLFSIFIVVSLLISSNIPAFANDNTTISTGNDVEIINVDITQYPQFDINNFEEYKPILEKYGIAEDNVIAILPISKRNLQENDKNKSAPEKNSTTSTLSELENDSTTTTQSNAITASVPAGVLVLTGTFVSSSVWKLTLLNVGILNVSDIEADVILINNSSGPIVNSKRFLGGLLKFKSVSEIYSAGGSVIDVAIATVTGITEDGEYFNMGGTQYRNQ
ncbi:hypothetical protein EHE19_006460 [Ruminiclostridium herbifermentans]|jgi:hypothetical protein|uniref:Uncharacterized protein n=1 Tax=Ruminiclostridium herbifermentans TaxID=2488810 RepID=A0A4V6EP97_9FIRM|nr:hypothetical protein [Ruminiclostridium herbifermentans]QNU68080.1 hypothetical protein EHE19_006460 [Ruminiclostridium herbifermentans]